MLSPRVGQNARGVVVHDLDVADQCGPRVQALEEIVRQQRVLGHAIFQSRRKGIDVVESLAREDALVEEVLIDVRNGGRVRIDPGMAGVRPGEERAGRARHGHADSRLQDPVSRRDSLQAAVEPGLVQRMRDDANQPLRGIARETRVRIEGDAIADERQHVEVADLRGEARIRRTAQQAVEFFDLAPLPLPADPRPFLDVPLPIAMEQEEAVLVLAAGPGVELVDTSTRAVEQRRVIRSVGVFLVREIAQNSEVDTGVEVTQREDLHVLDQRVHSRKAGQHGRDHHHRPCRVGNAAGKIEAWEPLRTEKGDYRALYPAERELACRNDHQQRHDDLEARARSGAAGIGDGPCGQQRSQRGDRSEIHP